MPGKKAPAHQEGTVTEKTPLKDSDKLGKLADENAEISLLQNPILWMQKLARVYSWKLLMMVVLTNHMLKGFVCGGGDEGLIGKPVEFIFADYGIAGPRLQVLKSIAMAPWALKPVIGVLSDIVPIFGYHKMPYLILTSIGSVCACFAMGFNWANTSTLVIVCLFLCFSQAATVDLLVEATQASEVKENSKCGPEFFTFTWLGINMGQILGVAFVGALLQYGGNRVSYLIAAPLVALVLWPIMGNWLNEKRLPPGERGLNCERITRNPILTSLTLIMGFFVVLLIVGTFTMAEQPLFYLSLVVSAMGLGCIVYFLRWEIAGPIVFWFALGFLSMNIDGALFYFYTNGSEAYPEGPHFTPYFYTAAIGLAVFGGIFVGFTTGDSLFPGWTYRQILATTLVLRCLTQLLLVPVFLRWTHESWHGYGEAIWVLTATAMDTCVFAWRWIPKQVMGSQLTPDGCEATVIALNAGSFNLAMVLSSYVGSYMLSSYGIKPSGEPGESLMFSSLWKAQATAALAPLVLLPLLPMLIPGKTATDRLITVEQRSATYNSPHERLFGRPRELPAP